MKNMGKKEIDYSFEYNSFLVMFKQAAEEKLRANSIQTQSSLEIVDTMRQNRLIS
jgi:hypothetical protein